ncbi:MAG TPA: CBS domain-containing protein [Vicinamibacterales bacterium]|nr:CBS domain-containing protein [Vicinamibacterales bacterium]
MTAEVKTVSPDSAADAAWEKMRSTGVHHLVVTKASRIVGLISDRDAGGTKGTAMRKGRTVAELMTAAPVTVKPDTPVRKAANLMRGRSIGSLVVTDGKGRLSGIVTVSDLLELLGRGIERPVVESKRWTLKHRSPHRKLHVSASRW